MSQEIASTAIETIETNLKCILKTIKLYFKEYMLLSPDQILKNSLQEKTRPSVCSKTRGRVFQLLVC